MKTKLFVVASSFLMTAGCFESSCNDKVLEEVRSPDGKYIATIFERDCGATTAYSRHVLLRASESRFDGASAENIVFTVKGQRSVEARWADPTHVMIRRVPNRDDVFKELDAWKGIAVRYIADWP